jgi:hypothetical protein
MFSPEISSTWTKSTGGQKHFAIELPISDQCIAVGSRLSRGGLGHRLTSKCIWKTSLELPRGRRGTRPRDTQPSICSKNRWTDQDRAQDHQQVTTASVEKLCKPIQRIWMGSERSAPLTPTSESASSHRHSFGAHPPWRPACRSILALMYDPRVILRPLEEVSIQVTNTWFIRYRQGFMPDSSIGTPAAVLSLNSVQTLFRRNWQARGKPKGSRMFYWKEVWSQESFLLSKMHRRPENCVNWMQIFYPDCKQFQLCWQWRKGFWNTK